MNFRRNSISEIQDYKIKTRNSFKLDLMDIPFLMIGGFTLYEIVEFVSVSILGKAIP
jgi:hypothetical protein